MNNIGKIRVKNIALLLSSKQSSNEIECKIESSNNFNETLLSDHISPVKTEQNVFEPLLFLDETSIDSVDLTDDKYQTPIAKEKLNQKQIKITLFKSKPKPIVESKENVDFAPLTTVKRAPKKFKKQLETKNKTTSIVVETSKRELRSTTRRKLLKDESESPKNKKTKKVKDENVNIQKTTATSIIDLNKVKSVKEETENIEATAVPDIRDLNEVKLVTEKNENIEATAVPNIRDLNEVKPVTEKKENVEATVVPDLKDINKVKPVTDENEKIEPTTKPDIIDLCLDSDSDDEPLLRPKRPNTVKSEKSICPAYKVIEGTTFAVDGFKYGRIDNVTVYFLTHFHADHYVGLTKKFSMPIYVSQITANLMREFIQVDEKFVHILNIGTTVTIEGVQVTAIDANHCPGAIMILFQLPNGKRILHTGDFRASLEMEQNPHLKQRNIEILYLDTTYISSKYSFQTQAKSIADAFEHVQNFKDKNQNKRILFVIGAYLVGKEKFWLPIAKAFNLKVWTDDNRRKIMKAIDNKEILERLVTKPRDADLHVISLMKIGYKGIEAYWQEFKDSYDTLFAIRPSGWEKNSKPQFRGHINIVGIEYSEHSSHNEMRRFVGFLKPKHVISTVPYGKDQTKCSEVPLCWYKKECFQPMKKQSSMLDFIQYKQK